jgi:enterochelin esterase-like enzyme
MGLTSGLFEALMIGLAAAALVGVVWLWPRVAGRRVVDMTSRAGLLAGSQLLVIAAFLTCLNGYFGFYGSWAQLIGPGRPAPAPATASDPLARALQIEMAEPGPEPGGRVLPAEAPRLAAAGPDMGGRAYSRSPAEAGRLLMISMSGGRTGISVRGDYVYLPPQYFWRAYARARFPVVLVMTGYPGSAWSIVKRLELPSEAARLVAARKMPPAVYVMMNVSVAMPRDTECTNVPAGPQVESFFAQDVPRVIERSFRVQRAASGWATLGYSTGGYCAAKLAMLNPYQFGSAVSLAGYYVALRDDTTGNLYGGSLGYRHENDLDWRLAHLPAPPVSVLVTSSKIGEKTYPGTLAFLRLIHPPMRGYSLFLPQGGHNFRTWQRALPQSLTWLGQRLQAPVPSKSQPFLVHS